MRELDDVDGLSDPEGGEPDRLTSAQISALENRDLFEDTLRQLTVFDLAQYRLNRIPATGADFLEAGLAMIGSCELCSATIAAYNACPSRSGFWRCLDCIEDTGWINLAEMATAIFGPSVCPTCHRPLEADH